MANPAKKLEGNYEMPEQKYEIGMVGLGVMGRNLVLNIADHGYSVSGYDTDLSKGRELQTEAGSRAINAAQSLEGFVSVLSTPRVIMMLVPAGPVVDNVIRELMPYLETGDLIIDAGNSHFKDTDLRAKALADRGILYMGVGVSGGEDGARHGPSLMPGGPKEAYQRVKPIFEAVAAHVEGVPCVAYLGPGSAGHYVKMVHNGIEYGLMQLIAESYDLMKRGLGLSDEELSVAYSNWNAEELNAFLIEITSHIFRKVDEQTGIHLVDLILDEARQKGTGMWTSQDAMDIQVPIPVIDAAVSMRNLSALKSEREGGSRTLKVQIPHFEGDRDALLTQLKGAIYASMIITYAQGMTLLQTASHVYQYGLSLEDIARIWRGGCIIRAAVLEEMQAAFHTNPDLPNLLTDSRLGQEVLAKQDDLRAVVGLAAKLGLPASCLMASLAYFDGYRSDWLPANLIQAQRDDFGAHTYERVDEKGLFHTQWE
jgi:6-phosphogluconate dehydrogenase